SRSNRSTFAAPSDGANDSSENRAASDFLGGVRPATLPFQTVVTADQRIIAAVDDNTHELQLQLRASGQLARFLHVCQTAINVGSFARQEGVVDVEIRFEAGMEDI